MSALDFLFQGQAPAQTTNYTSSQSQVPTWLQDYSQGLLSESAAVASQPYQQYGGPRVAGMTDAQTQAAGTVQGLQGQYQPALSQAMTLAGSSSNPAALSGALSYLPQAQNYINSSVNPTSAQINPYVGNVIQQAQDQANKTWNNTVMPTINNQFTSAGQYGSSANQRAASEAGEQLTQQVQDTSNSALAQAYTNAQQSNLAAGQATSALGQTAGGLGYEQGVLGLQGASQLGSLAGQGQSLGLQGASALDTVGGEQQQLNQTNLNTGYQDFLNQQQYPYQQASWLQQMLSGTATPTTTPGSSTGSSTGYAPAYSASPISQAIGTYSALNPSGSARGGRIRRARGGSAFEHMRRAA